MKFSQPPRQHSYVNTTLTLNSDTTRNEDETLNTKIQKVVKDIKKLNSKIEMDELLSTSGD